MNDIPKKKNSKNLTYKLSQFKEIFPVIIMIYGILNV